jgi:multidrug efflux pump subunit AcrB
MGGQRREVRIVLDPATGGLSSAFAGQGALGSTDVCPRASSTKSEPFWKPLLRTSEDVRQWWWAGGDKPVFLRNVAEVTDGGAEPTGVRSHGARRVKESCRRRFRLPSEGTNAVEVADIVAPDRAAGGVVIPRTSELTRQYGETAAEKSNELLLHMLIAVISVSILIAITLGRRESLIVLLAIPVTLALTLAVFYLYGYTLNRITLFALIFSIGILVDDAIVIVENIVRHWRMPATARQPRRTIRPSTRWDPTIRRPSLWLPLSCRWRLLAG